MKKIVDRLIYIELGFFIFLIIAYILDLWMFQEFLLPVNEQIPFNNLSESFKVFFSFKILLDAFIFIPPFYLAYYFIKPIIIDKNKFLQLILIILAIMFLFCLIFLADHKQYQPNPGRIIILTIFFYTSFGAGILFKYLIDYGTIKRQKEIAEKHQIHTELALLKSQISPHFLFNTLNNIDVLITKDPEKASVYMKKLSDILRFMLYETKDELIPMSIELEYIKKYIELQKIRTSNDSFVSFNINGKGDELNIAPMIFIPFIENAFKHTSNKKTVDAIIIQFDFSGDSIKFRCENYKNRNNALIQKQSGLGINLIKQRLNLLYKDRYILKVEDSDEKYIVSLTIQLNEN